MSSLNANVTDHTPTEVAFDVMENWSTSISLQPARQRNDGGATYVCRRKHARCNWNSKQARIGMVNIHRSFRGLQASRDKS